MADLRRGVDRVRKALEKASGALDTFESDVLLSVAGMILDEQANVEERDRADQAMKEAVERATEVRREEMQFEREQRRLDRVANVEIARLQGETDRYCVDLEFGGGDDGPSDD